MRGGSQHCKGCRNPFLDLLCSKAPSHWREYYSKVSDLDDLEQDIESGEAHDTIKLLWNQYKSQYWKKRDMIRLLRDLY
jgi:hypothetical protein